METIEIGSSPYGEDCAQVGQEGYAEQARRECNAFIGQLYRLLESKGFPRNDLPDDFVLRIKGNPHEFGTYYEVVCRFNEENPVSWKVFEILDGNCPELWDEIARRELNLPQEKI